VPAITGIALNTRAFYDELRQRTRGDAALIEIGHEITSISIWIGCWITSAPMLDRLINYEFLLVGMVDDGQQEFVWHNRRRATARQTRARAPHTCAQGRRGTRRPRTPHQIVGDVLRDPGLLPDRHLARSRQRSEIECR